MIEKLYIVSNVRPEIRWLDFDFKAFVIVQEV